MKRFNLLLLALVLIVAAFIGVRAAMYPVIFRIKDPSTVDAADGLYVVFSPLRSRAPEKEADAFLNSLQRGECGREFLKVEDRFCEKENQYRLTGWRLVDRLSNPDQSTSLHFKVFRDGYSKDGWGNAWVTVTPTAYGWKVTKIRYLLLS